MHLVCPPRTNRNLPKDILVPVQATTTKPLQVLIVGTSRIHAFAAVLQGPQKEEKYLQNYANLLPRYGSNFLCFFHMGSLMLDENKLQNQIQHIRDIN